jgi:predicted DsbA family dithiol-disulfide isomerase
LRNRAISVGLVQEEVCEILESRRFKGAVDEDWRLSREWGITAVPTFVIHGQKLVGAQPYGVLEEFVQSHNVPERGCVVVPELHF